MLRNNNNKNNVIIYIILMIFLLHSILLRNTSRAGHFHVYQNSHDSDDIRLKYDLTFCLNLDILKSAQNPFMAH